MKENDDHLKLRIQYKDFKIRILATFIAAYIATEYGGDKPFFKRLLAPQFYTEFTSSLIISFLLVEYIYRITCFLDRKYPWNNKLVQRIIFQIVLGIIVPTIGAFLLAAVYFKYYGINILTTNYHLFALPFIAALITLFNGYYYVRYLMAEKARVSALLRIQEERLAVHRQTATDTAEQILDHQPTGSAGVEPGSPAATGERAVYIVNTPLHTIPLRMEDICCFYRSNGINYVRTFDQTVNEAYVISQTLKEVEEVISAGQFFRINRQMIVSFKSCVSFRAGKGKGLELTIDPNYVDAENGMKELPYVLVSEDRVQAFKAWVDR